MQLRAKIIGKQRLPVEDMPELGIPPYGVDPYQYAVPEDYGSTEDIKEAFGRSQTTLDELQQEAPAAIRSLATKVDPKAEPNLPMSPAASGKTKKTDVELSPEEEISGKQLVRNYLQSLQVRRDKEAELKDLADEAARRGRVAMLAEGLSESASKMGNIMGTPTGSTLGGFGKEVSDMEMGHVDELRKIYQGSDPLAELAKQAQIGTLLEQIRASRSKTAQGEAEVQGKTEAAATRNAILAGKAPKAAAKPPAGKTVAPAKPTAEQAKLRQQEREYNERYGNIQQNLKKMADMVKSKGTFELLGTHNIDLERLNYNIAIDYAKLVDPESVAREGEVKAAQRYLLPISPSFEHGYTRPQTALQIIRNFSAELEQRAKSRSKSMESIYGTPSATGFTPPAAPTQQTAAPSGVKVYLKALTGDNKVRAFSEQQAAELLQQKQPNGQPMYVRVK